MKKGILFSNWINVFTLGIYFGLFSVIESIIEDFGTVNVFANIIGNFSRSIFFGLFFPLTWGLPLTLLFVLSLFLTDLIFLKTVTLKGIVIQTATLALVVSTFIFILEIPIVHLIFIPVFAVGQFLRFKKLRKLETII
jgi:hypothetical protein